MNPQVKGKVNLPGDKSISHRALMLAALSNGPCTIENLAASLDVESTIKCLRSLGVTIETQMRTAIVHGIGLRNFSPPEAALNCGNSGTTLRLLLGILSGSNVTATLDGDSSLRRRPMGRVISPLEKMGASIDTLSKEDTCPINVQGKTLSGVSLTITVPSAQVKSAVLLAGLLAKGETSVVQPVQTRDHTERLLAYLGVDIEVDKQAIRLRPPARLKTLNIKVPSDPSSSAFPIVASLLLPGSELAIPNLLLNSTRTGFLEVLKAMGADIRFTNVIKQNNEPVGEVVVSSGPLRAVQESVDRVATYIDEVPILALAATQASGKSAFRGLGELRIKESDRLTNVVKILRTMGGQLVLQGDDLFIEGPSKLKPYRGTCAGDHRLAMMVETGNIVSCGEMSYNYHDIVRVSFSGFYETMDGVLK